jgi:sugar lactone lactonase YvrE
MGGAIQGMPLNLPAIVTTLAGTAGQVGSTDATGSLTRFNTPSHITTDGTNLYVADYFNHTIRKIVIATGEVTTLAGTAGLSGSTDATGAAARFYRPEGITTDGSYLYVADRENFTIRRIAIATGEVTTLAGTPGQSGSTDATGAAARFNYPSGITMDRRNLYVSDTYNHTIRKIAIASGEVTTLAGLATTSGSTDGTGTTARFNMPWGITTDGTNLYIADSWNDTIRKIVIASGEVTTLAGVAGDPGSSDSPTNPPAKFYEPIGITSDGTNLYVTDSNDTIRKIIIATGEVTTLAGLPYEHGSTEGTGSAARFNMPWGITTDGQKLYVVDKSNHTIRMIK